MCLNRLGSRKIRPYTYDTHFELSSLTIDMGRQLYPLLFSMVCRSFAFELVKEVLFAAETSSYVFNPLL